MTADNRRPIFHIGYHKTATTWFQKRCYPTAQNAKFVGRRAAQDAFLLPKAFEFSADTARNIILAASGGARPLVCEEDLSGYLHNGGLGGLLSREVARRIKESFPDALIVIFIRCQPRMIEAAYSQYLRRGGTKSPEGYLRAQRKSKEKGRYWYKEPRFQLDHFDYQPLIEHYADLFGREAVRVHLYEQFASDPQRFLEAFARDLDLTLQLPQLDTGRVNASSTSRWQVAFLRKLNLLAYGALNPARAERLSVGLYDASSSWVARLSASLPGDRPTATTGLFSGKVAAGIADHFRDKNARLAAEWGLPLAEYGYPLPR